MTSAKQRMESNWECWMMLGTIFRGVREINQRRDNKAETNIKKEPAMLRSKPSKAVGKQGGNKFGVLKSHVSVAQ